MAAPEGTASETEKKTLKMFEPFAIKGVRLKNRVFRSAAGGKLAYYDGTINNAWKNFEKHFAEAGVAGIISATIAVDEQRVAPLEYPSLAKNHFVPAMRAALKEIKELGVAYFVQLGDPGYHTQGSLFPQAADSRSASPIFDFLYGYRSFASAMTTDDIDRSVEEFAAAAVRARDAGASGIEITASKGYLIHQFLNPGVNRRTDEYGGSPENRFRFLRRIVVRVREAVGDEYPVGVRLSAIDYNILPVNIRFPAFPTRRYVIGNGLAETIPWAQELEALGVDFLHVTRGYGFINPKENPGDYPLDQIRVFANAVRHLSGKAWLRAAVLNTIPGFLLKLFLGIGWRASHGENAQFSHEFKKVLKIPVLVNGGFQDKALIEETLSSGKADIVTMARPLIANPDLLKLFQEGKDKPEKPCTFCNRCVILTGVQPVGCYEPLRFTSQEEMEKQILALSANPAPFKYPIE
ncbi:MAG: NADH:flavin oxidoreductase [Byssovorax sp.]